MSSAVRQSSAQSYLQHNRIPGLFEELMASLIRDQPSEPLIHLMRTLQRKASERGVSVPVTLRLSPDDATLAASAGPRLPTASAASPAVKSLSATAGAQSAGRSYEKPWLRGSSASAGGGAAGSSMVVKKSTSGGELVSGSVDRDSMMFEDSNPLAPGLSQRHRQPSRASIASSGGEAVFLWSSPAPGISGGPSGGPEVPPAYATAALLAEAEADILGREFRQARGPAASAVATDASAVSVEAPGVGNSGNKTAARRPTAGSRLAAKEARRKQLEVTLAAAAPASGKKAITAELAASGNDENIDDAMDIEDGVLLLEDSEALAAEGARVSSSRRRAHGGLREVATMRQRDRPEATAGVAAAVAAEPQVRMTFCGRCFAVINAEDEENGLLTAAAGAGATPLASARGEHQHHVGGGFGGGGGGRSGGFQHGAGATGDYFDEFDQVGPHTGRTMTEVTDIESASQVTGPRRPSWTTPASGGRSSSSKSKRAATSGSKEEFGGGSTTRSRGLESAVSLPSQQRQSQQLQHHQHQQQQQQRPAASRGWGAAAEAADEFSDPETLTTATGGDRHIQQDTRLY